MLRGVEHGSGLVAVLVADLGGAEDIDGGEVEVALLRVVGRLLEQPSPVVRDHLGVGRELEGDVGAVSSVGGGRLLQDVGRLLEQPTPVVGDLEAFVQALIRLDEPALEKVLLLGELLLDGGLLDGELLDLLQ